jgi:hypothetical protein
MRKSNISINPAKIGVVLLGLTIFLVLAHVVLQITNSISDKYIFKMLTPWFDLDDERNIPTMFSSLMLFLVSLLLFLITVIEFNSKSENKYSWALLSLAFLFLSTDELLSFHERLINPVNDMVGKENMPAFLQFAWVIPVGIVLIVFVIYFRKFFLGLNRKSRINFLISFLLYTGGALGLEMIGSYYNVLNGQDNFVYKALTTIEESLENIGVIYFIYSLLVHISDLYGDIEFDIIRSEKS